MKLKIKNYIFLVLLVGFSTIMRLLPHPANFAPIGALALFSGFFLQKKWGIFPVLAVMFISDIFIGFYDIKLMAVVYGSFAIFGIFGWQLKNNHSVFRILIASFFASLFFYLTTNFAVWFFSSWYPKTLNGLILCYTLALPFFRNSLLGDIFYSGLFFGVYELCFKKRLSCLFETKKIFELELN